MGTTMILALLNKFKTFMMSKNGIIFGLIITGIMLIWYISILDRTIKTQIVEIDRTENNFLNVGFKLDSVITKNGKLVYGVNTLLVTQKELEKTNFDLYKDIENLKVKLKNVSSAVHTDIQYVYIQDSTDSTKIEKKGDSVFLAVIENPWIKISEKIELINNRKDIKLSDIKCRVSDSLTIVNETLYKKRWIFWKKEIGVKTHITSENPYFHVNRIESYLFKK
jgi:hypothetical protein